LWLYIGFSNWLCFARASLIMQNVSGSSRLWYFHSRKNAACVSVYTYYLSLFSPTACIVNNAHFVTFFHFESVSCHMSWPSESCDNHAVDLSISINLCTGIRYTFQSVVVVESCMYLCHNSAWHRLAVCQCRSTVWVKKIPPRGPDISRFSHKRFRIFNRFFTHLLRIPIDARLQIFIQLSPILTKLCHIKRD